MNVIDERWAKAVANKQWPEADLDLKLKALGFEPHSAGAGRNAIWALETLIKMSKQYSVKITVECVQLMRDIWGQHPDHFPAWLLERMVPLMAQADFDRADFVKAIKRHKPKDWYHLGIRREKNVSVPKQAWKIIMRRYEQYRNPEVINIVAEAPPEPPKAASTDGNFDRLPLRQKISVIKEVKGEFPEASLSEITNLLRS